MIEGFSRLSKNEKRQLILEQYLRNESSDVFDKVRLSDISTEQLIESFSENVVSTFPFPYALVPNFLIDGKEYLAPFVTEESSVVAAASKSAKFWYERGGFKTEIIGNTKTGHIHFKTDAETKLITDKIESWKELLLKSVNDINQKMVSRGGGILYLKLINKTAALDNYYQLELGFNTCNAMGANYINSCLEGVAHELRQLIDSDSEFQDLSFEVIMSILSNYSPENAVKVWLECDASQLDDGKLGMSSKQFAEKFTEAVKIAEVDVSRAVTHNKGFYNGLDSVALATGNDWRAIEANGHAYASRNGQYSSLSHASIENRIFRFEATVPLQVGTVGGITALHPLTQLSLDILGNPGAEELMKLMAVAGLASNFSAVKALVTSGIQKGHMKMHLSNILTGLKVTEKEKKLAQEYFADKTVSNTAVVNFLDETRKK